MYTQPSSGAIIDVEPENSRLYLPNSDKLAYSSSRRVSFEENTVEIPVFKDSSPPYPVDVPHHDAPGLESGSSSLYSASHQSSPQQESFVVPERAQTVPTIATSPPKEAATTAKVQRPRLNRFYSLPMHPKSPSRQHFRLHNPLPHHVKETPSISILEDTRGTFINQYQITRVVGRGSFGVVYLAVDEQGQQFALKECSKQRLAKLNRAALMRLRRQMVAGNSSNPTQMGINSLIHREIAVMKKLDHPNLVSLYEVLDDPNSESLILVLEWCAQGSIMPAEDQYDGHATPIPEDQARLYFRDLVLGVEYLHERGVCHRDIKADNVLLSDDVVKIADFGVSEIFDLNARGDIMERPVGSPAYMSPELVALRCGHTHSGLHPAHAPVSGRKADIWAMGVTLYYMVHGCLPFEADNMEELHSAILHQQPDLSRCPESLASMFTRIFDKDPNTRITLDELRGHSWVTQDGADPLLSKKENVQAGEDDMITEDDIRDAIELIEHRSTGVRLNYLDVSRSLRINHGWRGDGSSGMQTPRSQPQEVPNVKMEKLSLALEELLKMKDWRSERTTQDDVSADC